VQRLIGPHENEEGKVAQSETSGGVTLDASAPAAPPLAPGDPAPWFRARSDINPSFRFASLGGRYLVLSFLRSFSRREGAQVFRRLMAGAHRFGDVTTALLLVTADPQDEGASVPQGVAGVRYFFDFERTLIGMFAAPATIEADVPVTYVIDERLRVLAVITTRDASSHADEVYAVFDGLLPISPSTSAQIQAPVLIVPHVFEPQLCRALIAGYDTDGGEESGFMVERDGLTVSKLDYSHKRRSDWNMKDAALVKACHARIERRLKPEIMRAFQFDATRIERNTVACYDAAAGGHFRPHRDNTTKGTAHRRFAVSVNLNTEDYEGGELIFPEFGRARFRPPTGGACVFSCSLLHEATAVTRGKRYVYVPFLYDEAAAAVRQRNKKYLAT
jgi:peroxiredoxin